MEMETQIYSATLTTTRTVTGTSRKDTHVPKASPGPCPRQEENEAISELSMENRPHKDKRERSGGASQLVYAERNENEMSWRSSRRIGNVAMHLGKYGMYYNPPNSERFPCTLRYVISQDASGSRTRTFCAMKRFITLALFFHVRCLDDEHTLMIPMIPRELSVAMCDVMIIIEMRVRAGRNDLVFYLVLLHAGDCLLAIH